MDLMNKINIDYKNLIRSIPDYPEAGINFKDLSPIYSSKWGIVELTEDLYNRVDLVSEDPRNIDKIVIASSRGYILGSSLASHLCVGMVAAHKSARPGFQYNVRYYREYGENENLFIDNGLINNGDRVILHDDILATGGTLVAMKELVHMAGGIVEGIVVTCELNYLNGRDLLIRSGIEDDQIKSVIQLDY